MKQNQLKGNNKLSKLDSLRGFASVYVVLNHVFSTRFIVAGKDIAFLFRFGQEAVILFFFLSGFVIKYSFDKSKDKSFQLFFFKRFTRIYIPLLIIFLVNYLLYKFENIPVQFNWKNLLGNLFMLQDLPYPVKPGVICAPLFNNIPLWSLSYEWWFYMLFFLLQKKLKKNASTAVYLVTIFSTLTYLLYPFFLNRLFMYLAIWWVGADMAELYKKNSLSFTKLKIQLLTLLICTVLLLFNFVFKSRGLASLHNGRIAYSPFVEFRNFSFAFAAVCIAFIWKKYKWIGYSKTIGLFLPLAPISFALYISHWFLVANALYLAEIISNFMLRFLIYFIVCLAFSFVLERILYPYLVSFLYTIVFAKKVIIHK